MTAHVPLPVPGFEPSFVLATDEARADTAVVFVHGFLGDARGTWVDFEGLIDAEPAWDRADLYFLAYDSFHSSIRQGADRLEALLAALAEAPAKWFCLDLRQLPPPLGHAGAPTLRLRSAPTRYEHFVLVGHSLGGVLIREIVLRESRRLRMLEEQAAPAPAIAQSRWLAAALRLFAPAIAGARPTGLMGLILRTGGVGNLTQAWLGASRSYKELIDPQLVLADLRRHTEELAKRYPAVPALRADVLWPTGDDVVADREYVHDRRSRDTPWNSDHISVCKPSITRPEPLRFARDGSL